MKIWQRWRGPMAVMAAVAGVGFSTGREVALFFSQMGRASWIGVMMAAGAFGVGCGFLSWLVSATGAESFRELCEREIQAPLNGIAVNFLGILSAAAVGTMLAAAGQLGALALPLRNAFWIGVLFSAVAALILNFRGMAALPAAGACSFVVCLLFFSFLMLDRRQIAVNYQYFTVPRLSGSVTSAILFSMLFASMNVSISAGVAVRFAGKGRDTGFALRCGGCMLMMLSIINGAVLSGGDELLSQAFPTVILAARWGLFGYYACLMVSGLCVIATLAAALGGLIGTMAGGRGRWTVIFMPAVFLWTVYAGTPQLVEIGYPMLGWVCAMSMAVCAGGMGTRLWRKRRSPVDSKDLRVKL
ncbi:MAG: hypothetical protein U0L09_00685 [Christensenellales bacterium]|nr:hypothetical protein [Christensenellales bacterium]